MAVLPWVVGILVAVVCSAAARRVAVAKGMPPGNWAAGAFFLGAFGLVATAFKQPGDGRDRLAWWSEAPVARTWVKLAVAVAVVGYGAAIGIGVVLASQPKTFDGAGLDGQISTWLAQNDVTGATVTCPPTYDGQTGSVFFCDVTGGGAVTHVRVTVDNSNGGVEWVAAG